MSNNILRFADLGEAATRRILAGWCGPLVPEPPTSEHDHRKHRLMYMDCTSPDTVEGHVLTFTYSQWSRGTELVFEDGTPRGVGADVAVGRRVLSWETCWKWIQGAGMDCARPEVAARLAALCAQAIGDDGDGWRIDTFGNCWRLTDGWVGYKWPEDGSVYGTAFKDIPVVTGAPWENAAHFLACLSKTLAPKIAALS